MPKKIIATQAAKKAPVKAHVKVAPPKKETEPVKVAPAIVVADPVEVASENEPIMNEMIEIYKELSMAQTHIRNITQRMKCLEREVKKEGRTLSKLQNKARKKSANMAPRGFAKPTRISEEMATFFGVPLGTEMARTEAARLIIKYIQDNSLAKEENKKAFQPDDALQSILSPLEDKHKEEDGYTYFNLQHYIGKNFASAANNAKDI